jgi:uroporphyrinogen-III synthase
MKVLILRPEPGASASAARARALGLDPAVVPLFEVRPVAWEPPEAAEAVLLTSANAPRCGGASMTPFIRLPCFAVGEATAAAAEEAGFTDVRVGPSDGAALLPMIADAGISQVLHLCGRDRVALDQRGLSIVRRTVYAAETAERLPEAAVRALGEKAVALIHSPRAGALFGRLAASKSGIAIAAISKAAAIAAGPGWRDVAVADRPRDQALLELAAKLCNTDGRVTGRD